MPYQRAALPSSPSATSTITCHCHSRDVSMCVCVCILFTHTAAQATKLLTFSWSCAPKASLNESSFLFLSFCLWVFLYSFSFQFPFFRRLFLLWNAIKCNDENHKFFKSICSKQKFSRMGMGYIYNNDREYRDRHATNQKWRERDTWETF